MNIGDFDLYDIPQDVIASLLAYIGNDLSAEQREEFERRLLEDETFSEQTGQARELLLECYADGSLSSSMVERVERWIAASPSLQRELDLSRSLQRIATRRKVVRSSYARWWALVPLAACMLLAVLYPILRRQRHASTVLTAVNHPAVAPTPDQPQETLLLMAQRLRGGTPASIAYHVRPGALIRLQVVLPFAHQASAYTVTVKRGGSAAPIAQSNATAVSGSSKVPFVEIDLPANALRTGEYVVDVSAPEDDFSVHFQILP